MKCLGRFRSDFLFSTPSFLSGAGSVMNIAGNYYEFNDSTSGIIADHKAIDSDFRMIGQDISDIIDKTKIKDKRITISR